MVQAPCGQKGYVGSNIVRVLDLSLYLPSMLTRTRKIIRDFLGEEELRAL